MINTNNLITAKAVVKRIRMSPVKVRRVLKLVKNCSYQDALILLEFLPYKACGPVWQVLRSAVANAEYKYQFDKKDLRIKEIYVNQGPVMKRFRAASMGRASKLRRPSSHLTIILTTE